MFPSPQSNDQQRVADNAERWMMGHGAFVLPCLVAAVLLIGACSDADLSSTRDDTISRTEACPECRLALDLVATLSPQPPEIGFVMNTRVRRDGNGSFYVAPLVTKSRVAVFSSSGDLVRTFGRTGRGPGEFDAVANLHVSAMDSLFVIDSTGRISVYDPEGEYVRSFLTIGLPDDLTELNKGRLLLNIWTFSGSGTGPLWAVDRNGEERVRFQTAEDTAAGWIRRIDVDPNGDVWSVSRNYEIETFDSAGTVRHAWRGDFGDLEHGRWFRPSKYAAHVDDVAIPQPGRMWVLLARRDTAWRPAATTQSARPMMLNAREAAEQTDFYLDVIEPHERQLIARESLGERFVGGFVNDTLIYTLSDDPVHDLILQVWRIRLVQP